jgi:hypothetical protein
LTVIPETSPDAELSVKVAMRVNARGVCTGPDYDGCIVAKRKLRYAPNQRLRLPITLDARCLGVLCDDNSTCDGDGKCVPQDVRCEGNVCAPPPPPLGKDDRRDAGSDGAGPPPGMSTPDGGPPPSPDGVLCNAGGVACRVGAFCCWNKADQIGTCAEVDSDCLPDTLNVSCDGKEDCPAPQLCCEHGTGFGCQDACPSEIVCNDHSDCPGDMACKESFAGIYMRCVKP